MQGHKDKINSDDPESPLSLVGGFDVSKFKANEFLLTVPRGKDPNVTEVPVYKLSDTTRAVPMVLQEWRFGLNGLPAIQDLNAQYGGEWRAKVDKSPYLHRATLVKEYKRLVLEECRSDPDAIQDLETTRGTQTRRTLYNFIRSRQQPTADKSLPELDEHDDVKSEWSKFKAVEFEWRGLGNKVAEDLAGTIPIHHLSRKVKTVPDVLREWRFGSDGEQALQDLNSQYGTQWRAFADANQFKYRTGIVTEYIHLVLKQNHSDEEAIRALEKLRNGKTLCFLYFAISARRKLAKEQTPQGEAEAVVSKPTTKARTKRKTINKTEDENVVSSRSKATGEEGDDSFPLPIRDLSAIGDVWKEWTVGWKGEPSIESLMEIHGKAWGQGSIKGKHYSVFSRKNRVINIIREAVEKGASASVQEAIQVLEKARRGRKLVTLLSAKNLRGVLDTLGIEMPRRESKKKEADE